MGLLIAIDPGSLSGEAEFEAGELANCRLIESPWDPEDYPEGTQIVCEFPFIYPQHKGKGDGNDLLTVARIAGRLTALVPEDRLKFVYPRTWKGNVPKEIMLERILGRLTEAERALVPKLPKSKLHNVIDAIGIGLHALGRLGQ